MISSKKLFGIFFSAAGLSLLLALPVWAANTVTNTDSFADCSVTNGPPVTVICPTGQRFIGGTCRSDSNFGSCTGSLSQNFNCVTNSCVCPEGFRDCRDDNPDGCLDVGGQAAVDAAGAAACDSLFRVYDQCAPAAAPVCGVCRDGYSEITLPDDSKICVESCDANTELYVEGRGCVSLAAVIGNVEDVAGEVVEVDTRLGDLEGSGLCHYVGTRYVQRDNPEQDCLEPFDPADLSGNISTLQMRIEALGRLLAAMLSLDDITALLDAIISGNPLDLPDNLSDLIARIAALENDVTTVSLFVGFSGSPVSDGNLGGYVDANNECAANIDVNIRGSHICTAQEIINTYVSDIDRVTDVTGRAWINNGPPAYFSNRVNDCNGWHTDNPAIFGSVWLFDDDDYAHITPCSQSLGFACCK